MEDRWSDDLLKRKPISEFLRKLVVQKMSLSQYKEREALCFAIDADWGAGKSFFLKRWAADLRDCDHIVIEFDAWSNDLSEDPLIGFMAELRSGLSEWKSKVPVSEKIPETMTKLVRGFRKAFLPTLGVLAKGFLKNKFGKEAIENLESFNFTELDAPDGDDLGEGLDKFLEKALDEHQEIKQAIDDFKKTLQSLLDHLTEQQAIRLPLFVIVDELDRCRPNYAIRLLEGIKHLFGAPNVCFVISTNLQQMSESVRSVYGAGFDGAQYLKRFFAFEYILPEPDLFSFCHAAIQGTSLGRPCIATGLPDRQQPPIDAAVECLSLVANAFGLTPRSITQVLFIADAATIGIAGNVHLLYLFFLAALKQRSPSAFDAIAMRHVFGQAFVNLMDEAGVHNQEIHWTNRYSETETTTLFRVIQLYSEFSHRPLRDSLNSLSQSHEIVYPDSLQNNLIEEVRLRQTSGVPQYHPIHTYPNLLKAAGYLKVG